MLRFTPRVALVDEAVLLEVRASLRLFGGGRALRAQVAGEARRLGAMHLAAAPTALAALALARCPVPMPTSAAALRWSERLDRLPLHAVTAVARQVPMLSRLGCTCLGDVRRLPRAGLARRFGAELLAALDQVHGHRPETFEWLSLPDTFAARLELPGRVDNAPALMFGARRLLLQLTAWLAARHAGVRSLVLHWQHDFRPQAADDGGHLQVRTAELTRDVEHLSRLLTEMLAHVRLAAPVGELRLTADEIEALAGEEPALPLQPGLARREGESLQHLLERLSARLGAQRVLRPVLRPDHRPEAMQHWVCASQWAALPAVPPPAPSDDAGCMPQPTWLLPQPLPLAVIDNRPHHGGPLQLLSSAQRIESGWWDGDEGLARDYYIAHSERAGLLWIYRERPPGLGWYLHGVFA